MKAWRAPKAVARLFNMLEHVKCGFLVNHAVALITAGQVKT